MALPLPAHSQHSLSFLPSTRFNKSPLQALVELLHPSLVHKTSPPPLPSKCNTCDSFPASAVTPFDVLKTRLQAHSQGAPQFNSTRDAFFKIVRSEGVFALWRGLNASFLMTVPATALYFTAYERFKMTFEKLYGGKGFWTPAVAGLLARTLTVCVTSPVELIRTNVQSHAAKASGDERIFSLFRTIYKMGGLRALWGGLGPTLIRDTPFSALYWSGFEGMKVVLHRRLPEGFVVNFTAGATSGMFAAAVTTPIDVVKTRRQMYLNPRTGKYPVGTVGIFKQVIAEEGCAGLFSGLIPRVGKVAPACAIMISSYEVFKKILKEKI